MCPADYPYLYMNNEKSNILIGNKRHWRTIDKTLCTFMTSIELINKYWDNFYSTCLDRNEPFEKYLNKIYKKELCISPLKSLSVHMTNVNSNYGLSPFINYKKLWDENQIQKTLKTYAITATIKYNNSGCYRVCLKFFEFNFHPIISYNL